MVRSHNQMTKEGRQRLPPLLCFSLTRSTLY